MRLDVSGLLRFGVLLVMIGVAVPVVAADHTPLPSSGLLAHWQFDEVDGQLRDAGPFGIEGTLYGGIERGVTGVNNSSSYHFDGVDGQVELYDTDRRLETRESVTFAAWFRPDTMPPEKMEWLYKGGDTSMFGMWVDESSRLAFYVSTSKDGGEWLKTVYDLTEARWVHAVGTYNGSMIELYVDGELVDTQQQSNLINGHVGNGPFIASTTDSSGYFDGRIDDMRIYNRSLDPSEVELLYGNPPGWHPSGESTGNDTTSNESGEGTDDQTAPDNETEDGTVDNGTTMDNETSSDSETSSSDESLFEGGNGTDGSSDDGMTTNGSSDGTEGDGSMNDSTSNTSVTTNDTRLNETVTIGGDGGLTIRPDRLSVAGAGDGTVTRTVSVSNGGDRAVSVEAGSGLAMVSVSPGRQVIGPGGTERFVVRFDLEGTGPGGYDGVIRVTAPNVAYSIPVDLYVQEGAGADNDMEDGSTGSKAVVEMSPSVSMGADGYFSADVFSSTERRAFIVSEVRGQDGQLYHRQTYNSVELGPSGYPLTFRNDLRPGNYTWNVTVETATGRTWSSQAVRITETPTRSSGPGSRDVPWLMLVVIGAVVVAGVVFRDRLSAAVDRWRTEKGLPGGARMAVFFLLLLSMTASGAASHDAGDEVLGSWLFNETEGDLRDWSGHAIDGVLSGGVQRGVAGVNDSSAYRFDGEDDWIAVDDPDYVLEPREGVTLESWFRPHTISPDGAMRLYKSSNSATFGMYVIYTGRVVFYTSTSQDGGSWQKAGYLLPSADRWYHAVGTYNGSMMRLYLDGELVATQEQSGLVNERTAVDPSIGATRDPIQLFDGEIDRIRIYNRSLSASEVESLFANPPGWHPSGTQSMTDDTTSNETSDDTANETDDGTMDNESGSTDDGAEDTEDGTMEDGETGGSLFTGGNGTEASPSGDGAEDTENGTSTGTGTTNGTTDNTTADPEGQSGGDRTTVVADTGLAIRPDRFGFRARADDSVERTVEVINRDDESTRVNFSTLDLPMAGLDTGAVMVPPGGSVRAVLTVELTDVSPGQYMGAIRVEGEDTVATVPVRFVVEPVNTTVDGGVSISLPSGPVRLEPYEFLSASVLLRGDIGSVNASVVSRVFDASGTVTYEQRYDTDLVRAGGFRLTVGERPPGNYTWNITVRTPYETAVNSTSFTVEAGPVELRRAPPSGGGSPWLLFAVFLGTIAVLVGSVRYRDRVEQAVSRVR